MNDAVVIIAIIAAVNPAAAVAALAPLWASAGRTRLATLTLAGGAIAVAAGIVIALAGRNIANAMDLEPESFRVAAGVVFAVGGGRLLLFGPLWPPELPPGWLAVLTPVAVPVLLSAEYVAATATFAIDEGRGLAIAGAVVAQGIACAAVIATGVIGREHWGHAAAAGAARLTGLVLVAVAAGLVVSGVRDV
jgi:small neutral amino acid transporter SnatA (MarC family)